MNFLVISYKNDIAVLRVNAHENKNRTVFSYIEDHHVVETEATGQLIQHFTICHFIDAARLAVQNGISTE